MGMAVLDTDFLIDLMRARPSAVALLNSLLEGHDPVAISAISVMQLYHGVARSQMAAAEEERVDRATRGVSVYDFTREIAERAGRIDGKLVAKGARLNPPDVMIAATALVKNEPVVTRNLRDFGRIQGVRVISY
jgi:tRNA(fMet)-specific endonuclease VapC